LLENESSLPLKKLQYELGQFRARLGNIYATDRVNTKSILEEIMRLEGADRRTLAGGLEVIKGRLAGVLNKEAGVELRALGLLPVPVDMRA
jgi:hypothetical protein